MASRIVSKAETAVADGTPRAEPLTVRRLNLLVLDLLAHLKVFLGAVESCPGVLEDDDGAGFVMALKLERMAASIVEYEGKWDLNLWSIHEARATLYMLAKWLEVDDDEETARDTYVHQTLHGLVETVEELLSQVADLEDPQPTSSSGSRTRKADPVPA